MKYVILHVVKSKWNGVANNIRILYHTRHASFCHPLQARCWFVALIVESVLQVDAGGFTKDARNMHALRGGWSVDGEGGCDDAVGEPYRADRKPLSGLAVLFISCVWLCVGIAALLV